ncbi:MAG: RNA polymerase sigma factor [Nitrospira sp.]
MACPSGLVYGRRPTRWQYTSGRITTSGFIADRVIVPVSKVDLLQAFEAYALDLRRFLTSRVHCEQAAADLVQETYMRVIGSATSEPIHNIRSFLFQIANNLAIDHLRSRTRFQQHYAGTPSEDLAGSTPLPDRELTAKQDLAILQKAISELPTKCRSAFLLHRLHHLSYSQIAQRLGVSQGTVEKHISHALAYCRLRVNHAGSRASTEGTARIDADRKTQHLR